MKPIEINEKPIMPTDYEEKYNFIVAKLEETVFDGIAPDDCWDVSYDKMGNEIRKKRATKKNELKPVLTPSMVDFKLQSLLRLSMPMTDEEAKFLAPQDYLTAFHWYFELMYFCSSYITLSPTSRDFVRSQGLRWHSTTTFWAIVIFARRLTRLRTDFCKTRLSQGKVGWSIPRLWRHDLVRRCKDTH